MANPIRGVQSSRHTPLGRQPGIDVQLIKSSERHMECAYYLMRRKRFRGRAKPTVATQAQDHFPDRICFLHQFVDHFAGYKLVDLDGASLRSNLGKRVLIDDLPIDRLVHELLRELDPFSPLVEFDGMDFVFVDQCRDGDSID
ncbi:MAG: hypothetical protein ACK41S_19200 [Planctomycetota bacterium]